MSGIIDYFVSLDIFGHPVGVNYKGSGVYKTKLGAFVTLVTQSLMIFNLITASIAFFNRSRQVEVYQASQFERFASDQFRLEDYNVTISIVSNSPLTEDIGKFKLVSNRNCPPITSDEKCIEEGKLVEIVPIECSSE